MHDHFSFECVGCGVTVQGSDAAALATLRSNFSGMAPGEATQNLIYDLQRAPDGSTRIVRAGSEFSSRATDMGDLIYKLEADLVVQLQLLRSDLFFLHAATVTLDGNAHLLVGRSGAGKSTTCWGLQHHGFGYLSDELAPIRMSDMMVHAYAHALCMKAQPPASYPVPQAGWYTPRGVHIPISPGVVDPHPVRSIFIVEYAAGRTRPEIFAIGRAEAAARLYPNALNALAHAGDGLDAVTRIASAVPAFRVECADLADTCNSILVTATDLTP